MHSAIENQSGGESKDLYLIIEKKIEKEKEKDSEKMSFLLLNKFLIK